MVSLSDVVASNKRITTSFPDGLVAVFIGGTSGVGEYTVKAFARYVPKPRVYIIGRSKEAADRIIDECQGMNSEGCYEFIQADISLLRNIDDVCRHIKSKESTINLLFQSQGSMGFTKSTSGPLYSPQYFANIM
jgi:short-subunit dehydrogenase